VDDPVPVGTADGHDHARIVGQGRFFDPLGKSDFLLDGYARQIGVPDLQVFLGDGLWIGQDAVLVGRGDARQVQRRLPGPFHAGGREIRSVSIAYTATVDDTHAQAFGAR
jgi:hypothetical protein